jgi:hypothetical protein
VDAFYLEIELKGSRVYSDLSTTFGSSRDARHAGRENANPAISAIVGIAIANVVTSVGATPNSSEAIRRFRG